MTMRIERRRGKECFVIDMRPSTAIRRAKARSQKRSLEIHKHFVNNRREKIKCPTD